MPWRPRRCNLLIFDEPTRGIDVAAKAEIHQLIRNFAAQEGKAAIVISSEVNELVSVSDRIIVMSKGQITGELEAEEIEQNNVLSTLRRRKVSAVDKAKNISLKKLLTGSLGTVLGRCHPGSGVYRSQQHISHPSNIRNILIQSGTNAIIAVGMTYVIISGNIDISVGASLALSSCVGATLMVGTGNVGLGVAAVLLDRYPAGTV